MYSSMSTLFYFVILFCCLNIRTGKIVFIKLDTAWYIIIFNILNLINLTMSQDFPTPLEIKALAEGEFSLQWAEIMKTVCK